MKKIRILCCAVVLCISFFACWAKPGESHMRVTCTNETIIGKCSWYKNTHRAAVNPKLKSKFVAMRWDYKALAEHWNLTYANQWDMKKKVLDKLSKSVIRLVHKDKEGNIHIAFGRPADWGPHPKTGRTIDLDKNILKQLNCETDDLIAATLIDGSEMTKEEKEKLVEKSVTISADCIDVINQLKDLQGA